MARTVLDHEEAELDVCLGRLHDTISQEIATLSSNAPELDNYRTLQAQIRADMTQFRAHMRDLEFLADEQETYVFIEHQKYFLTRIRCRGKSLSLSSCMQSVITPVTSVTSRASLFS